MSDDSFPPPVCRVYLAEPAPPFYSVRNWQLKDSGNVRDFRFGVAPHCLLFRTFTSCRFTRHVLSN
jgi:hypothetical protein